MPHPRVTTTTRQHSRRPLRPVPPISAHASPAAEPGRPGPTIRTMIVCLPDLVPAPAMGDSTPDRHLPVPGTPDPRFWVAAAVRRWHRRQLTGLLTPPHGPRYCAGGPVGLLDLAGMRRGAALSAGLRHQCWSTVVRGTPAAVSWPVLWQRHLDHPGRYPYDRAITDFEAQPRIQAMRLHNAALPAGPFLNPVEVDVYQAGAAAYCHFHALWVICGDTVITATGTRLQPDTDHLADRTAYLAGAVRHLDTLDHRQRLIAVTI